MTEPIKLPPLPEWIQEQIELDTNYPVSTMITAMRQYAKVAANQAIKADRQARGNTDASTNSGEPVGGDDFKVCAIADSNYAAGMLLGWNLCLDNDEATFSRIREDRLRAAAQASRAAMLEAAPSLDSPEPKRNP